jgi:predicted DsbA family dithiol-disulfide isomerase
MNSCLRTYKSLPSDRGITGIPAFLLDRKLLVLGAYPKETFEQAWERPREDKRERPQQGRLGIGGIFESS